MVLMMLAGCMPPVPDTTVIADCSVVRLDQGKSFCRSMEPPPEPPPFCTKSIGAIDCWRQPPLAVPPRRGVADGPTRLTDQQEAYRTRRFLWIW